MFSINRFVISILFLLKLQQENNTIYSWGNNLYGQLGINEITRCELIPQKILIQEKIISICCGHCHSIILSSNHNFIEYF